MLDSGDGREPCTDASRDEREPLPVDRRYLRRQNLAAAWRTAGAILLIGLVPLQLAVWLAAILSASGTSRPFAVVTAGLFGISLSFAGAILHLKRLAKHRLNVAATTRNASHGQMEQRPADGSGPPDANRRLVPNQQQ